MPLLSPIQKPQITTLTLYINGVVEVIQWLADVLHYQCLSYTLSCPRLQTVRALDSTCWCLTCCSALFCIHLHVGVIKTPDSWLHWVISQSDVHLHVVKCKLSPASLRGRQIEYELCCGKGGNVISAGWQVTLCDSIWHVSIVVRLVANG